VTCADDDRPRRGNLEDGEVPATEDEAETAPSTVDQAPFPARTVVRCCRGKDDVANAESPEPAEINASPERAVQNAVLWKVVLPEPAPR
jgi:hypothetical protein